ncbi:SOS response-associated peptidase family protein [Paenibacillus sp. NPDC056579]|uniref:SOS response-associated peptidase family protein n=1 Tax=Paenibacillus sp. NPDC056579 TaxID=3345871 RepID=UPI0036BD7570
MCDRFILHADLDELNERYGITRALSYYSHQNNRLPNESIAAITQKDSVRTLDEYRWGLMPFWARDSVLADNLNVFRNRAFDYLVKRQRCVIPGSSFDRVTWLNPKKEAVDRYIAQDGRTFAMAGVYDVWKGSLGEELRTCTIVTRKRTDDDTGSEVRVPILFDEEQVEAWLDPKRFDKTALMHWLESIQSPQFQKLPVSLWDRADGLEGLDGEALGTGTISAQPRIAKP